MFAIGMAGMVFAQTAKKAPQKIKMNEKVHLQVAEGVFEKAYHEYTDLIMYTDNAPAKKQEQALLEYAKTIL